MTSNSRTTETLKPNNMTIAQQLKITNLPFEIKDEKGRVIYHEERDGYWCKREYDQNGNQIYFEDSNGWWWKCEFDQNGNQIYIENGDGYCADNRPKPEPEPKQETLEEAAMSYLDRTYSLSYERTTWQKLHEKTFAAGAKSDAARDYWFEQFKNKGGGK
jgi:hypothetical protein